MKGLVSSVRAGGVHQPALVRPREGGGYEIIAGHRRQRADYSLAYVASWSKGTELAELKASLNVIHSTAGEIIDAISPPPPKLERTQEQRPRQKGKRRAQKTRR